MFILKIIGGNEKRVRGGDRERKKHKSWTANQSDNCAHEYFSRQKDIKRVAKGYVGMVGWEGGGGGEMYKRVGESVL